MTPGPRRDEKRENPRRPGLIRTRDEARYGQGRRFSVIGRFLLGSGLGALVGTGFLALASLFSPLPAARPAVTPDPAPVAEPAPEPAPQPQPKAEPAAEPAPESAPDQTKAEPEAAPSAPAPAATPEAPEAAPDEKAGTEPAVQPAQPPQDAAADAGDTTAPAAASAAPANDAAVAPQPVSEPPADLATAEAAAPATAPTAPTPAEAPAQPEAPAALATVTDDTAPASAGPAPAPAPEVAAETAPAELAPPTEEAAPAAAPAAMDAPVDPADPVTPDQPQSETAPATADLPAPPPLTPEEEALLRQLAEGSPGNEAAPAPDAAETPAAPAADAPVEDKAGGDQSSIIPAPQEPMPEADATAPKVLPLPGSEADAAPAMDPAPEAPPETADETAPDEAQIALDGALPPAPGLSGTADGVTTDRLPRIGEESAAAATDPAPKASTPLERFARPFENPEAKPVFAIVLIDDGAPDLDRANLAALPFPVTFALDPLQPDAAKNAAIYRTAGQEVVMLAGGLPKGAAASDVEVTLAAMDQALPEAVAVMDTPDRSFQADRPLASLVVPVIAGQGRGVLTWDQGLNAADQVARREDVPAAVAFRDLDGADETPQVMRRYLDRAAFKAAQGGRVTVVGRTRPDTIAAILEWTVEGRAATVALAPLSAALSVE